VTVNGSITVSVVVPTYRRPRQLQACLEALAAQTLLEPWEVVVVDDGSPEPPVPSVESLVAARGWQLVRQANAGPSAARNRGVREARGEFIAFTDDDCLPEPGWLEMLLQEARARPNALVGGTTVNGLTADFFASTSQLIVDLVYEHFNADPDHGYFLASNNILCSRAGFQEVGGFDESFPRAGAEDRDFCDRWRMWGWPIAWRPEARVEHRHGQSFRQFVDLYIRYGRGAYRYQAIRKERGSGTMREDLGFHKMLPRRAWRRLKQQGRVGAGIATVSALSVWQVANAAGFLLEAILASENRTSTRSQPAPSHRDSWG
jgi:GT2 family glycosyltransferase